MDERIEQAASFLDQNEPGWFDRIDTLRLDITSVQDCIMGQLFGNWYDAPYSYNSFKYSIWAFECEASTCDWIEAIHERKENGVTEVPAIRMMDLATT